MLVSSLFACIVSFYHKGGGVGLGCIQQCCNVWMKSVQKSKTFKQECAVKNYILKNAKHTNNSIAL